MRRLVCVLILITVMPCFCSVGAETDPEATAKAYVTAQFEAMLKKDVSILEPFFVEDDAQSAATLAFEKGRIALFMYNWERFGSDLVWYSAAFESSVLYHEGSVSRVALQFTGDIKMKDTGERLHKWNNQPREIGLIYVEGKWLVQEDHYYDHFFASYGPDIDFAALMEEARLYHDTREGQPSKETPEAQANRPNRLPSIIAVLAISVLAISILVSRRKVTH